MFLLVAQLNKERARGGNYKNKRVLEDISLGLVDVLSCILYLVARQHDGGGSAGRECPFSFSLPPGGMFMVLSRLTVNMLSIDRIVTCRAENLSAPKAHISPKPE